MAVDYDLVVCGDSFCCSTDIELKMVGSRAHFSQQLEDRWGWRVLNLAHGGVSNTCILWQIREAVAMRPRAIVYNRTFEGRLDIIINDRFQVLRGLRNWAYWNPGQTSYHCDHVCRYNDENSDPSVISVVHQGLKDNRYLDLDRSQLQAVDAWLLHFFNWAMMGEMSDWMFQHWHEKGMAQGIQMLSLQHTRVGKVAWDFSGANPDYDTPFHTDRDTQTQIAQNVHGFLTSGELLQDGYLWMSRNWDQG